MKKPDLEKVMSFVVRLAQRGFFGKLTLSFQNGKITDLRTEQTMKVEDISEEEP